VVVSLLLSLLAGAALGIGSDSGGSIRQPAHNCGIAGLKPTRGLIPATGAFPIDGSGTFSLVASQGPMARFIEDLIYVLPIIAGPDGHDLNTFPAILQDPATVHLKSLRIAYYTGNGVAKPTEDIEETIRNAALALSEYVGNIKEDYPQISKDTHIALEELIFYCGDKGKWLLDRMQQMQVKEVAPPFQAILDRANQCEFSANEFHHRLLMLDQLKYAMANFMDAYDVIICPAATTPANFYPPKPSISSTKLDLALDLTYNLPYNITGWPAVVVRCGTSKEGLPIGVQVIAKAWREDIALAVAKKLEDIFGGWKPPHMMTF